MFFAAATALTSCKTSPKTLVLYYSQTGTTASVAEMVHGMLPDADIASIEALRPYDGTYAETIARCQKEMAENVLPELVPLGIDLDEYDTVFLGYPIWFGTCARPLLSLLESYDFSGKKIIPFCTFGSGGLNVSSDEIQKYEPAAEVLEGYGVRTARLDSAREEIERFLVLNGYIPGDILPYPDFPEAAPVTEEETAIFDEACSDYQFPLGTAVAAASRRIDKAVEYRFVAASQAMDGSVSESVIYVIVPDGGKAVFTQVVR